MITRQDILDGVSPLNLPDAKFEDFKARLNNTIHELVFAIQHMDQGDFDDAQNCLVAAGLGITSVEEEYQTYLPDEPIEAEQKDS